MVKRGDIKKLNESFKRLIQHLIPISKCDKDISFSDFIEFVIPTQWRAKHIIYTDENGNNCPCGHANIHYLCYIRNIETNNELYIGNECVKRFSTEHWDVASFGIKIREGVSLTLERACCTHLHMSFTAGSPFFKKHAAITNQYGNLPINLDLKQVKVKLFGFELSAAAKVGAKFQVKLELLPTRQFKVVSMELTIAKEKPEKKKQRIISLLSDDEGEQQFATEFHHEKFNVLCSHDNLVVHLTFRDLFFGFKNAIQKQEKWILINTDMVSRCFTFQRKPEQSAQFIYNYFIHELLL